MAAAAAGPRLYRPRRPERTVLYRALAAEFERFLGVYEDRFERTHGYFRRAVEKAVYRYLDCGIFAHGVARAHCSECGHDVLVAFSCKLRCLCPSCHQKRELLWTEWAAELLAEVPHRQVVFTIPKRLRIYFRFDRKLLGELPGCAWRAIRLYFRAWFDGQPVVPGAVGFLQTAGELLGWHPHLHVLLSDGGWLPDGTFRHLLAFDSSAIEKLFRAEVLRLLDARSKISEEVVANLLSWRHSGFSVHAGAPVDSRPEAVRLGRYGIRCPLVLERLSWDETSGEIGYRARAGHRDGRGDCVARWDVLEFLARVLDHVPDPGQQLLRYWGWYSNAARGRRERIEGRASAAPAGDSATDPDEVESRRRRLTWSQLIRKVYELDPLLCPYCGSQLEIVAFVVDWVSLRRLLTHLGFAPQQPEPLAHAPPHDAEPRRAHA
ncbi:MAG TPA: transposase [Thermoanaerobaculia bacterium]|jgi:hypothetical protein|nr:transposase [Thermoanaerobaculia bacterium]